MGSAARSVQGRPVGRRRIGQAGAVKGTSAPVMPGFVLPLEPDRALVPVNGSAAAHAAKIARPGAGSSCVYPRRQLSGRCRPPSVQR
ncbi:MAG: hypothetical protein JWP04_1920 [Belnapia sp.]|nr:hypothetical protein [Belnapia sp.]